MSPSAQVGRAPHPANGWGLTFWCGFHGVVFAWVGIELPVTRHTPLPLVVTALALMHFATAVGSLARTRHLPRLIAALTAMSTFAGAYLLLAVGLTARRMLQDFGAVGSGLAAALGGIAWLVIATTAPFPLWWLHRRRTLRGSS